MMYRVSRRFAAAAVIALCIIPAAAARAEDEGRNDKANRYLITNLDSDLKGAAAVQDTLLQNSWGVAFSPAASPFWIADNASGCSTLYNGDGTIVPLQVNIPLPGNVVPMTDCQTVNPKNPPKPTPAAPTGIIWNPSSAFVVPGTQLQAAFIFDTEDGTISAWAQGLTPATNAVLAVDNSQVPSAANGAVYKGLAFGVNVNGAFLFATNFRAGTIDVFGPPTTPGGLFTTATSTSAAGTVANPASGSQPQGRGLAALPPSTATPAPNNPTLPETQRYQVPSDFDANVGLHPYTSGLGPCPHAPCGSARQEAPSHYNH
jgi:hypothetical protein